jgi:aspartate/methionine/tyrosine aminotransferase
VISLFSIFTDHVLRCAAERLTLPADLPAQDLELLWDQAIAQVDAVTRADAMAVLAEFVAVQPDSAGVHRFGQALAWVVANDNGGGYGKLHGQPELRAVAARHLLRAFAPLPGIGLPQVATHNVSFTSGANEAIGALFRLLQASGYLRPGDVVGMLEPVYSPYLDIARNKLNLRTVMLKSDAAHDWDPTEADLESFAQQVKRLNRPLKVFCLVNPNNPSSRAFSGQTIDSLARLLKTFNCLVIEDTVYHEFVPAGGFHSLWARLPEQTVLVHSMSKYYRVTGSRLGMVVVTDGGEEYIRQHILHLDRPLTTP